MRIPRLFPAAAAVLAAVLAAGCSTSPSSQDRTVTSSVGPSGLQQSASQPTAKQRYDGMVTEGRTGYVKRRVERQSIF